MPVYRRIAAAEIERFARQVLETAGLPPEHAAVVADNLTQGELHGLGSHGVSRLLDIYTRRFQAGGFNPRPEIRLLRRHKGTAVVDGDDGPGAVVGRFAMNLALELAAEHGSGWVTARNSAHFGAAFLFAREALPRDMIGFASTAAVPQVAPFGGRERALGTNPICVAVPGGERGNIILDMATTVVAHGKVEVCHRPTTDAVAGSKGSMLPLGGYKGYGLALMVEVFSSILAGAQFGDRIGGLFTGLDEPQRMGHFFGAMEIEGFMDPAEFRRGIDELIAYVKGNPLAEGYDEILVPGEPEARKAAEYGRDGIPVAEDVIAILNGLGAEHGVAPLAVMG
jgi:LDH2 family malate/lactate/ureidoglycolate dehydrogenase